MRNLLTTAAFLAMLTVSQAAPREIAANISFEPRSAYGQFDPAVLANDAVGAVDVVFDWATVEPQQGTFDFAPADRQVAAWHAAGKKFVIVIRYLNEKPYNCDKPQHIPAWLVAKVPHFCDVNFKNIIPNYFDDTFRTALKTFVKAVADHFANSPYKNDLLYVRAGVGLGSEGFFLTPCRIERDPACAFEQSKAQLVQWGYTPQRWKGWQKEMLSFYKSAFFYSTVIYPIVNLDVDPDTGNGVQMDVAYWAAANGIGVGAQGLGPRFADGPAKIRTILTTIRARHPDALIQLQTVGIVGDVDKMRRNIALAAALGANAIEWYPQDILNPQFQTLLRLWKTSAATGTPPDVGPLPDLPPAGTVPPAAPRPTAHAVREQCRIETAQKGLRGAAVATDVQDCLVRARPDLADAIACRRRGVQNGLFDAELAAFVRDCRTQPPATRP